MCKKYTTPAILAIVYVQAVSFSFLFLVIIIPTHITFAEVRYENKVFNQNLTLKRADQPFYFSGYNTIPKGVSVYIEKGTQIFIDGNVTVKGKLVLQGEESSPITIRPTTANSSNTTNTTQFSQSLLKPFTVLGGELAISHTNIRDVAGLIDAYSSSTVLLDNIYVENVGASNGSSVITIFNNSILNISNSVFKNVISGTGLEIFNQSSVLVTNTSFSGVGAQTSILVYDGRSTSQNTPKVQSTLSIKESIFTNETDVVGVSGIERVKTRKAIEIFNGAYGQIELTNFEGFTETGISAFSNARLKVSESIFTKNKFGINSYDSYIQISESEIFGNIERGAVVYGGTIDASNNWWGNETGPRSVSLNPTGRGDVYEGTGVVSPWKQSKPKKKIKCCSSVLFVPGMQASRMYKKGVLGENQLWEPNTVSDISKMYLTKDGYSIDKTLYFRDIIERTNVLYGGNDDIEIYRSFIKALDGLNFNFSIQDWQFSAYDWRMSPNTIVTEGTRYGFNGQYKKMEDQVVQMAQISKTNKVTLIAHSYGGIVSKRFLAYLAQRGKIGLIDKVIFVAVPENGSPSALFALLHGDNQDLGNGFIVNKSTMRKFAQNMPSLYSILPKIDSDLIYGMQATNTISIAVPSITSVQDMYGFLFKEIPRPSTDDWLEVNVPLIANKKIKQNIDTESGSNFIKLQTDPSYKNIEFYSILGVGLDTPKSITYSRKPCQGLYVHPFLMSPNCGLNHEQIYSELGDGTVLADDVLLNIVKTPTSASYRWGEKFIFNIAEYNRKNNKNYGHSNIISSSPVISILLQILLNNIDSYSVPAYITRYGGIRGGESVTSSDSASNSTSNNTLNNTLNDENNVQTGSIPTGVYKNKKYKISASDIVLMSAKDQLGNVVGVNFPALVVYAKNKAGNNSQGTPTVSPSALLSTSISSSDIIPTKNTFPNSTFSHVGDSYYISTEALPTQVVLKPDQAVFSTVTGAVDSSSPPSVDDIGTITANLNFKIEEILPPNDLNPNSLVNLQSSSILIASFENIPVTEYSNIEVMIPEGLSTGGTNNLNDPSNSNNPNNSGGSKIEMKVTEKYEGVHSNTTVYTAMYPPQSSSGQLSNQSSNQQSGYPSDQPTNQIVFGQTVSAQGGGSIDIAYLIGFIRAEIQKSGLRKNFKNRYVLKLNTVEKNYKSMNEKKKSLSKVYARDITASLAAIIKDQNRVKALYYRGGMTRPEAAFLHSQFSKLSKAFGV